MKYLASSLALVLLATPALAQSIGEKTGVNSILGVAPTTADFVKEAAISDMFEVQSSELAQERGKRFGEAVCRHDDQGSPKDLRGHQGDGFPAVN